MIRVLGATFLVLACGWTHADTFVRHPKTFRVGPSPSAIAAVDLNGDGIPEIVTANRGRLSDIREERPAEDSVSFLLAEGPLQYVSQPPLRAGFGPYAIAIANIDALKAPDILVASFHAVRHRDLTLLRNIGDNLFEPHHFSVSDDRLHYARMRDAESVPIFTMPGLTSLVVEDFDRDGYRDVVATGWSSDVLVYFPGVAVGYFGEPVILDLEGGPRDVVVADFDGDRELDLAVALYSSNEIALLRGEGGGRFVEVGRIDSRGRLPHRIRFVDMNLDGEGDLVVSHVHTDDSVVIFYGDGGLSFSLSQEILLGTDRQKLEYEIRDMAVADFTGNGRMDLALACHEASSVVFLANVSKDSSLPQRFSREVYTFKGGRPRAFCISDLNQDGKVDLGVALWESNAVALLLRK